MKIKKIAKRVILLSVFGLVCNWAISYYFFPTIKDHSSKYNQPIKIYFMYGNCEGEIGLQRLLSLLNDKYLLKPYHGVKELYFSAWQIIDDDYPTKDIYAHIWIKPYNNRNLISMWSYGDEYVNAIFSKSKFEKKAESELKIISPYIDPIGLYQFDNIYYYTYNNRKENQKKHKEFTYTFSFPNRRKTIYFHYYDYGLGFSVKMSDMR